MKYFIFFCIITVLAVSCVSTTKFSELNKEKQQCAEERELLKTDNEILTVENTELSAFKENVEALLREVANDTVALLNEISDLERQNQQLLNNYDNLKESQETLLKGSARETKRLLNQLQVSQEDLQKREDQVLAMEEQVEAKKKSLEDLRFELEKRNARLLELERLMNKKDSATNALKQKVQAALLGFKDEGLDITQKNGKVYVSLDEKLLFGSGSTEVDVRGKRALEKLARVLELNPDINVMIEGHTDDVDVIPSERMMDNWDLSVLRATSIVRILLNNASVDPKRLTVAGRGEYAPLDNAKTDAARQKNRRTEIILEPNLDELFELF